MQTHFGHLDVAEATLVKTSYAFPLQLAGGEVEVTQIGKPTSSSFCLSYYMMDGL